MNGKKTIVILKHPTVMFRKLINTRSVKNLIYISLLVISLSSMNTVNNSGPAAWNNPVINPYGQNLASYLKAYYKVGDIKTMRKFIVFKDLNTPSEKEVNGIMLSCNWGYDFRLKNCTWLNKEEFYLTVEINKMNTAGIENYYGIVIRDTARLMLNKQNLLNPFAESK